MQVRVEGIVEEDLGKGILEEKLRRIGEVFREERQGRGMLRMRKKENHPEEAEEANGKRGCREVLAVRLIPPICDISYRTEF